jgi:ABC-type Fe3+/spermidine/putrescine transport system ATPase subunit
MNPVLEIRGLTVAYGDNTVLDGVDLTVGAGTATAVLGPSGSGKSTLLGVVAGFVPAVAGEIHVGGERVVGPGHSVPPEQRKIAMVFQDFALWPHLSVMETVAYPMRVSGVPRAKRDARASELLEMFGIEELADRYPDQLSGGQQQRVGLARAMARGAEVMLLDEPTAHLDSPLRTTLQGEIRELRHMKDMASVVATHDAAEALAVSDQVALLRNGRVVQSGSPREVYESPVDLWAARLTGPAALLGGEFVCRDGEVHARLGSSTLTAAGDGLDRGSLALVRPDWMRFGGPLQGVVLSVHFRGTHTDHVVSSEAGQVEIRTLGAPQASEGDRVTWSIQRIRVVAES